MKLTVDTGNVGLLQLKDSELAADLEDTFPSLLLALFPGASPGHSLEM